MGFGVKVAANVGCFLVYAVFMAAMAVCAARLVAQNPADDPGGWTKAKWGMTEDELNATFPHIAQMQDDGSGGIGLPRYVIENHLYAVRFLIAKDTGLRAVHITYQKKLVREDGSEVDLVECGGVYSCASAAPQGTPSSSSRAQKKAAQKAAEDAARAATQQEYVKAEMNEQAVRLSKDDLLRALTTKYGNPASKTMRAAGIEEFVWQFPTTQITLMWAHGEFKQFDSIQLFYTFRKKSSDL
jgi:hypothetical protein